MSNVIAFNAGAATRIQAADLNHPTAVHFGILGDGKYALTLWSDGRVEFCGPSPSEAGKQAIEAMRDSLTWIIKAARQEEKSAVLAAIEERAAGHKADFAKLTELGEEADADRHYQRAMALILAAASIRTGKPA